jgi:hypothetical protein
MFHGYQKDVYMRIRTTLLIVTAALFFAGGCRSSILDDPTTTIMYSVDENSFVTLQVENSYDTVVATLVDGPLNSGYYSVSFNVSGLTEGIYYYTLTLRSLSTSKVLSIKKKMLLIK